jgi:hypothetical protein
MYLFVNDCPENGLKGPKTYKKSITMFQIVINGYVCS